jgi:hypothetical protein
LTSGVYRSVETVGRITRPLSDGSHSLRAERAVYHAP